MTAGDSSYQLEPWLMTPLCAATVWNDMAFITTHTARRAASLRGASKCYSFCCLDRFDGTQLKAAPVLHSYCISRPPSQHYHRLSSGGMQHGSSALQHSQQHSVIHSLVMDCCAAVLTIQHCDAPLVVNFMYRCTVLWQHTVVVLLYWKLFKYVILNCLL